MIVRILLVALLALVAAVAAGHFIAVDPGFIVIGIGGKVVRSTFAFFVIVLLAALLAFYIAQLSLSVPHEVKVISCGCAAPSRAATLSRAKPTAWFASLPNE